MSFGHTDRIKCEDDVVTICHKLSEGNPGALNVIMQMLYGTVKIDPDTALGPFAYLLNLDSFGIYGSKIWVLYKDICCENIVHTITVLRAVQLGILPLRVVNRAINGSSLEAAKIDIQQLFLKVQELLPAFGKI